MKTFLHRHLIKCKIAVTFKRPGNKTKRVAYLMTNNSIFSPLNLDFKQQLLLTNYDLSVMGIYLYVLYDVFRYIGFLGCNLYSLWIYSVNKIDLHANTWNRC